MLFTVAGFQYSDTVTSDHKAPIWRAYAHEFQSNFIAELLQLVLGPLVISSGKAGKHISFDLAHMPYDFKILVEFIFVGKRVASTIRYLFRYLVVVVFKTLRGNQSLLRLRRAPGHSKHELLDCGFFF